MTGSLFHRFTVLWENAYFTSNLQCPLVIRIPFWRPLSDHRLFSSFLVLLTCTALPYPQNGSCFNSGIAVVAPLPCLCAMFTLVSFHTDDWQPFPQIHCSMRKCIFYIQSTVPSSNKNTLLKTIIWSPLILLVSSLVNLHCFALSSERKLF